MENQGPAILVVRSEAPFADFAQFIAYAKRNPGSVRVGTAGVGSSGHIFVETINSLTGAAITDSMCICWKIRQARVTSTIRERESQKCIQAASCRRVLRWLCSNLCGTRSMRNLRKSKR